MMFHCRDSDDPIPASHFRQLYERRLPPEQTQVWLGAFTQRGMDFHRHVALTLDREGHPTMDGYGATFTVGHLVVQVFGHQIDEGAHRDLVGPLAGAFIEVWPYARPITWPPRSRMGFNDLIVAANAFG